MLFCALFGYFFPNARCLLAAEHKFTLYGALYFMVPGVYGAIPVLVAWMSNNSEPYYRRAATVGLNLIFSSAVCYAVKFGQVYYFLLVFLILGRCHEYLEFPIQGRTEIHENDNHMPNFVSFSFDFCLIYFFFLSTLVNPFWFSCILTFLMSFVNMSYLSWRNKVKKRPGVREKLLEGYMGSFDKESVDGGLHAWTELGDQHPDFVYTL